MEKIWVIAWVLMTPSQGDGVYQKDYGIAGPFEEHTCWVMADEISRLASRHPESHALIATCRKMKPEDGKLLEKNIPLPRIDNDRQDSTA